MKRIVNLLLLLVAVFFASESYASHLLGSEITYTCVGPNQYRVRLTVYRDCAGISAETSQTLRYSSAQCGVNTTITLSRVQAPVDITPLCPSQVSRCSSSSGPYGIQEVIYEGVINLPPGCGTDWVLSWNLCCRNDAINNLGSPGNQDMGVTALLNNTIQPLCNNSPVFNNAPAAILCINQPFVYNHGVVDPDGDSLYFTLGNCLQNATTNVNYTGSWNPTNPLPTVSGVTINPNTGAISFTPNQTFVGVICIKVEEYRNGVKIGEVNRDMQFRVINCSNNPPEASGINGAPNTDPQNFQLSLCANNNFCFDILFNDPNNNNITVSWNEEIPAATFTVVDNGTTSPTATFCWSPPSSAIGQNVFSVNVFDDACPVIGIGTYTYVVNVTPSPNTLNAGTDQTICLGESATLTATSTPAATSFTWTPVSTLNTSTGATVVASPLVTTSYEVTASFPDGCDLTDVVVVNVAPDPVISITPLNPFNCANQNNTITATASNAATYSWAPGGFNTPTINVAPAATTTYTVTVTSPFGCTSQASTTVNIAAPAGNVCNVLYVTPTGLPTASGTKNDPMDLETAMTVGACNGTVIKMAIGDYVTDSTINRVTSYLTLEGGFDPTLNWDKLSHSAGAFTRILRTATMTTSTLNGSGVENEAPPYPPNPNVTAIRVTGQTGFRFQDLTVEVVSLAGNSPILGYRGVNTVGVELNTCDQYNIVRTRVRTGAASNGSNQGGGAPATDGGSSWGINIISNGAGARILSSNILAGAAGIGGAGTPNGANGTSANVAITGTALLSNENAFNLDAQPVIRMDDIACTNTITEFSSVSGSNNWVFGAGSSPANQTGATVNTLYTSLGRKDISYGANNYVGFNNIILDDQIIPTFTTSAPFVQGQFRVCAGDSVSFQVTNGGVGYTYIWTSGSLTYQGVGQQYESFITAFDTPGIYPIQLNFETGCCGLSIPAFLDLYVEEQPEAIMPPDEGICFGSGVGVQLTIGGGVPGGSISWVPSTGLDFNNSYTVTAEPPVTTTYEVTLADSTGLCVSSEDITVSVIELDVSTVTIDATCGPDGSATVNVSGGSGNYSYLWSDGQTGQTANNLQVGTYTVLVTDLDNGCQDSTFAVVNPAGGALVGFISNSNDISCFGLSDGSITVTIVGGQPPFVYDWGPQGSFNSNLNSNTISNLPGDDYEVTVTDDLGCTYNVTGNIFEPSQVLFELDTLSDPTCEGTDDGFIRITTDGGIAPYTYTWTQIPGNTTNEAGGLGSGSYTLVATDFNGCIDSFTVSIQAPPIPLTVIDTTVCEGTTLNIPPLAPILVSGNDVVNDTLLVSGCFEAFRVNITSIPLPTATISGSTSICSGENATILFSGTANGIVTYNINGGGNLTINLDAGGNASVNTGGLSANTTYNLVSVETGGTPNCTQTVTGSATITVIPLPTVSISGSTTICEGANATISFTGTPDASVTYNIDGGANLTIALDASGNASLNSGALNSTVTYNLVSVSTTGTPTCSQLQTGSATITVLPLPTASVSGTATICNGDNANITFNGTPNATVTYNNGTSNQTIVLNASGQATLNTGALSSGITYTLVSVESNTTPSCTAPLTGSATVTVLQLPTVSISGSTAVCDGGNTVVTFTGTPNSVVTYNINGGANQTITLDASGSATVNTGSLSSQATYTLVSVALQGTPNCLQTASGTVVITINPLPTANISGTTTLCQGESTVISFSGTPNTVITYTVNGGANQTINLDGTGNATLNTGALTQQTTYSLVNVNNNGCINDNLTGTATVGINPSFSQTLGVTICSNESHTLPNGQVVNVAGVYPVSFQTAAGCDSTITTTLTVNQLGTSNPLTDISVCEGFSETVTVNAQNMVSYEWFYNTGSGNVSTVGASGFTGGSTETLTFNLLPSLDNAEISVRMTDACGNVFNESFNLRVYEPTAVENPVEDQEICLHELPTTLTVDYNGYNYVWDDGTTGPTVQITGAGEYVVNFFANVTNCRTSDTIVVTTEDCIANCVVLAPTGFTPDENGKNDIFRVVTNCDEGFSFFEFRIYNRWGELVYLTNNHRHGWDGNYKGRTAEIGVYTFYVEYVKNLTNKNEILKGNVTLIR